jgi:hypothetical protein
VPLGSTWMRRSGGTSATPSDRTSRGVGRHADRLADEGRLAEAVNMLAAGYRAEPRPEHAVRLIDLRHEAALSLDPVPGRSPWPPAYADPFPEIAGQLPETAAPDLTTDVMGGAVAHHGALVVRELFDEAQVARCVHVIRSAQEAREQGPPPGPDTAWYRPFPSPEPRDRVLRNMVAGQGGIWLADSPASTEHFLGELASAGAIAVISAHLGERPCFSLQKSTMRRSAPVHKIAAWHQDGSFLDPDVRTINVWAALSRCGGDYPSPGLEVVPRRFDEILPVEGDPSPHAVSFEVVEQIAADTPTLVPAFEPGDAVIFDERFLHRTHLSPYMTEDRYALECWFFAPSHRATGYVPFLV